MVLLLHLIKQIKYFGYQPWSIKIAHKYRSTEDGILVGVNTILDDNPSLTLRKWNGKHPNRYVLDPNLRLYNKLKILKDNTNNNEFS